MVPSSSETGILGRRKRGGPPPRAVLHWSHVERPEGARETLMLRSEAEPRVSKHGPAPSRRPGRVWILLRGPSGRLRTRIGWEPRV